MQKSGRRRFALSSASTDDQVIPELKECSFRIACDVTNPLCGERGCSAVYGPQKGATPEMVKDVLCEVYSEVGLVPDCSTDFYGEEEMENFIEKEKFLREKGDEYLAEFRSPFNSKNNMGYLHNVHHEYFDKYFA